MNNMIKFIGLLLLLITFETSIFAHAPIQLKDNKGALVQKSGMPVSISETCGDCHDTNYIATHNTHAAVKFGNKEQSSDLDCFTCHIDVPDYPEGNAQKGIMATIVSTTIVKEAKVGWLWESSAFLADGTVKNALLEIRSPEDENCLQCHKMSPDQISEVNASQTGHLNSDVFSGDKLNQSSFNIADKSEHNHSWDVHAEKMVKCVNCHYSDNNPSYYRESDLTRPAHLKFDSRKLSHEKFRKHPSHQLANTPNNQALQASGSESCTSCHNKDVGHDFLEAKAQHFRSLSCESCHISETYSSIVSSTDRTILDLSKRPVVNREKANANNGVLVAQRPLLLLTKTKQGEQFKPYRMATTWFWKDAITNEVVDLEILEKAYFDNNVYKTEVIALFDNNQNQILELDELLIDSDLKKELIAKLLRDEGIGEPVINTDIQSVGIHHGVVGQQDIVKECSECHDQESRLTSSVVLAKKTPFGAEMVTLLPTHSIVSGAVTVDKKGTLYFSPQIEKSTKYVFSAVRNPWVDSVGLFSFLGVVLGIFIHGGLRMRSNHHFDHKIGKQKKVYIYKAYERIWHWLQALSILMFIFTGLEIHFAGQIDILGITGALTLHNLTAIVFITNGILGLFFYLSTGSIQQFFPPLKTLIPDIIEQAKYYGYGIFNGAPHPTSKSVERRLNSLQQITYLGLMFGLIPLQLLTGVLLFTANDWPQYIAIFGGLKMIGTIHTLSAWLFVSFLVMHIYLTTTGHTVTANVKAMVNGWEEIEQPKKINRSKK